MTHSGTVRSYRGALLFIVFLFPAGLRAAQPAMAAAPRDLHNWCNSVTRATPQVKLKSCTAAGLKPVAVKSVNGRQIMRRQFKPVQEPVARVLVVGGIHGDELTAISIVFRWIELVEQ